MRALYLPTYLPTSDEQPFHIFYITIILLSLIIFYHFISCFKHFPGKSTAHWDIPRGRGREAYTLFLTCFPQIRGWAGKREERDSSQAPAFQDHCLFYLFITSLHTMHGRIDGTTIKKTDDEGTGGVAAF